MRAKPTPKERPEAFHGIHMDFTSSIRFLMLTCNVGLLSGVGKWALISIRHPHIPRPWNPIRASFVTHTRIKRLVRRTICFSKTEQMHDLVIGLFITYGSPIFKVVQQKWCKALYTVLKQSPTPPEYAVGEDSEGSNVDQSVVVLQ